MRIRHGYYATWRGTLHEASPDGRDRVRLYSAAPLDGFVRIAGNRHVRVVAAAEVGDVRYVNTVCEWRGEPFLVLAEHKGWLRVEYTGGKAPVAERLGLERFDRGVYQAWAPHSEVTGLHETTA